MSKATRDMVSQNGVATHFLAAPVLHLHTRPALRELNSLHLNFDFRTIESATRICEERFHEESQ